MRSITLCSIFTGTFMIPLFLTWITLPLWYSFITWVLTASLVAVIVYFRAKDDDIFYGMRYDVPTSLLKMEISFHLLGVLVLFFSVYTFLTYKEDLLLLFFLSSISSIYMAFLIEVILKPLHKTIHPLH